MKRMIAILLTFILLMANAAFVSAEHHPMMEPAACSLAALEPETQSFAQKLPQPNTPPPAAGMLSLLAEESAAEQVRISQQIYDNLIAVDPSMFLLTDTGINRLNGWDEMTKEELAYVKRKSAEIIGKGAKADEKIRKVAEYVSKNVCYDYDYVNHNDKAYTDINHSAYDVLVNESAVCYGYAAAAAAMLLVADVPCIIVHSPNHAWNMAYNGQRWVLFDPTWMSGGVFEYGELHKSDVVNMDWFDFTIETANNTANHVITECSYTCYDSTLYSFPEYTRWKSYEIPENITGIDSWVFAECSNLKVTVKGKLKYVGEAAFYKCTGLDGTVDLSELETVENYAFTNCAKLDEIISLEKATSIGEFAFYQCSDLDGVIEMSCAESIGTAAFEGCRKLDGIQSSANMKHVGIQAFYGCADLGDNISLPQVETIGTLAFSGCTDLDNILETANLKTVGDGAFQECDELESIDLTRAEAVGMYAFSKCSKLKHVTSLENVKTIGDGAFLECRMLGGVLNLANANTIGEYAFYGCTAIEDAIIGDGVTALPTAAFYSCGAEDIILPASLQSIGDFVFAFCNRLKHFYYAGTEEQWKNVTIGSNNYNFYDTEIIYNYTPHVNITKPTDENPSVTVTYEGVPDGEVVMFCEYDGNHFLGMKSVTLTKEMTFELSETQTSKINIFIFDDFFSIKPTAEAESVTLD